jgi:hypothetical protein
MLTIILFFVGFSAAYWLGTATVRPSRWRVELPPEDVDRGPNADPSYRAVMLGGHDYWFTAEEVADANERAIKYSR